MAAITTDSAPNMVSARKLLVARADCKHIINMGCMMHGFALILKSVLAHSFATTLISTAQRVVTFFRSSHQPLALLANCAAELGVRGGLKTSNQTRITSVHMCLESVLRLEEAFKRFLKLRDTPGFPAGLNKPEKRELLATLEDRTFWCKLEALCKLLEPLTKVIMAVQGAQTTIADLAR